MTDSRPRVSRPLAMLSVVLLLTLVLAPSTLAAPADDDRPTFTFNVIEVITGWFQNAVDATFGVIDVNGQPAPPPPSEPPPEEPTGDDTEDFGVIDPNG